LLSFLGSDPPKVFLLLIIPDIHYAISECVGLQVLCTSDVGPFLQFLIFVLLSCFWSALKAPNQPAWLLLEELSMS